MSVFKDERFKHIISDPKFRNVPKKERKIKIDKRFQSMFTDKKFQIKYSVDKRGRPIKHSNLEDYRNFYDLSSGDDSDEGEQTLIEGKGKKDKDKGKDVSSDSKKDSNNESVPDKPSEKESSDHEPEAAGEEEEEGKVSVKKLLNEFFAAQDEVERSKMTSEMKQKLGDLSVDYARGFGSLETDSSSDEVSSEDSEEEIEHNWGELDKDAERTDDATKRIAVCNMDWDRVTAPDLMVLFNSFTPSNGYIESVTVYPSEYGLSRMKEEDVKGPIELTATTKESSDEEDEDDNYNTEKLREYQLKRLKYYYAVVVFDSAETANKVYTECDGMEYESSSAKLDLRFIPDDMTFDQEPREVCDTVPDINKYRPRLFVNTALQQGKVNLTWDETDPRRVEIAQKLASGDMKDAELIKDFIATSSEESEDDDANDDSVETESKMSKMSSADRYRSLLLDLQEQEQKKKEGEVEMEITWDAGLEKPKGAKKSNDDDLTPFERFVEKRRQKVKEKLKNRKKEKEEDKDNLFSDDELPSDVDLDDPYFKEEMGGQKKKGKKKGKKQATEELDEDTLRRNTELELLLADDAEEQGKQHFSLKKIQEREAAGKKKKKQKKTEAEEEDNFKIDLKDERFGALFTSHLFNVDPADSHFRKTKAMDEIINEKSKRRRLENHMDYEKTEPISTGKSKKAVGSSDVSKLINSIKRKTKNKNLYK